MEKKLNAMFDYQRFENNSRLAKMIAATEARYAGAISDDELVTVAAAGETEIPENKEKWSSPRIKEPNDRIRC